MWGFFPYYEASLFFIFKTKQKLLLLPMEVNITISQNLFFILIYKVVLAKLFTSDLEALK